MMRIHTVAAGGGSILHSGKAVSGRPRLGRRQSRPRLLPPRRPADGNRRQCHARQAAARLLPCHLRSRIRTSRSMSTPCATLSMPWRRSTSPARAPKKSPKASSPSPSRTWPTPSRRSRCSAAMTSPDTCSTASAAPAASTPAWWPMRWAWNRSSFTPSPACSRPTASASQASSPAASRH
jgi:hypothetical protein